MIIHTDSDGRTLHAFEKRSDGADLRGTLYMVQAGLDTSVFEFQRGPLAGGVPNGLTNEMLVQLLLHRLNVLQTRQASPHNMEAMDHLTACHAALNRRQASAVPA